MASPVPTMEEQKAKFLAESLAFHRGAGIPEDVAAVLANQEWAKLEAKVNADVSEYFGKSVLRHNVWPVLRHYLKRAWFWAPAVIVPTLLYPGFGLGWCVAAATGFLFAFAINDSATAAFQPCGCAYCSDRRARGLSD